MEQRLLSSSMTKEVPVIPLIVCPSKQTELSVHQTLIYLLQVPLETYEQADISVPSDHYKQTVKT